MLAANIALLGLNLLLLAANWLLFFFARKIIRDCSLTLEEYKKPKTLQVEPAKGKITFTEKYGYMHVGNYVWKTWKL